MTYPPAYRGLSKTTGDVYGSRARGDSSVLHQANSRLLLNACKTAYRRLSVRKTKIAKTRQAIAYKLTEACWQLTHPHPSEQEIRRRRDTIFDVATACYL